MSKRKSDFGTLLVALPDFASSIVITSICLFVFERWDNILFAILAYCIGGLAAVSPDLDYVWTTKVRHLPIRFDHRLILHKPVLWLIPGLVLSCVSPFFAILLTACFLAHFVDDIVGNSQEFGVQVFWPLSSRTFVFFTNKSADGQDTESLQLFRSWVPAEFPMPVHEEELEKYYFVAGPKMVFTTIWFLIALALFLLVVGMNIAVYW